MDIGVDLSKRNVSLSAWEGGKEEWYREIRNTREDWLNLAIEVAPGTRFVLEASGNWSPVVDLLEAAGMQAVLPHPGKVRLIAESKHKNDRVDARILGQLLHAGMIPEAYIPPKAVREDRDLLRHRIDLGRDAARVKNRILSLIERSWAGREELDELSDAFGKDGRAILRSLDLPSTRRLVLYSLLRQLENVEDETEKVDEALAHSSSQNADIRKLMQIGGINYYAAQVILSEIGDVSRFPDHRKLASYAGLVPSERSSGGVVRRGHITKEGSSRLRWILVDVVDPVVRYNPKLAAVLSRIREKRGTKVARVAVARHLLRVVYYMLRDGRDYEFRNRPLEGRKLHAMERKAARHQKVSKGESPCI